MVELPLVAYFQEGPGILSAQFSDSGYPVVNVKNVRDGYMDTKNTKFVSEEMANGKWKHFQINEGDILLTTSGTIGRSAIVERENLPLLLNTSVMRFRSLDENKLSQKFLYWILSSEMFVKKLLKFKTGMAQFNVGPSHLKQMRIPLPPLEVQKEIVAEIDGYQKIIDGAKQVVKSWKPSIKIDPKWEMVELGEICENLDGKRIPITKSDRIFGGYPYYGASGIVDYVKKFIFDEDLLLISEDGANLLARSTPIAFSVNGKIWVNNHAHVLKFKNFETQKFVEIYVNSINISDYVTGMAQPKLNQKALKSIKIPLPPLKIQKQIVAEIEAEQKIIDQNKKLIEIFEGKIKEKVGEVWGE